MGVSQSHALDVASWRREVHALYSAVRACASPAASHATWVAGRMSLFMTHAASPRREGQQLRHAPYDPAFRFVLPVVSTDPDRIEVATGTDGVVPFERIGRFDLPSLGSLDVWWLASYGGGLFVPLRDASAGSLTYGAGRYLLDTIKGADLGGVDARLVLDFNFAYNPSCAYNPVWTCPLAPPENRLGVDVAAGERVFAV
jgi:uncharacterized protein (DUF1684 family)